MMNQPCGSFDTFISYSSKDKLLADATCAALEHEAIRCWIAPRDVRPGAVWAEEIIDAIEQCRVLVLIWTANSNASKQVLREIEHALSKGLTVIPLQSEQFAPSKSLTYFLKNTQWLDAISPPLEKHLKQLARTMKHYHAISTIPPKQSSPLDESIQKPRVSLKPNFEATYSSNNAPSQTESATQKVPPATKPKNRKALLAIGLLATMISFVAVVGKFAMRDNQNQSDLNAIKEFNGRVLSGHKGKVASLAYNFDGTLLVSTGQDKTIRVWDIAANREKMLLTGDPETIQSISTRPNDRHIATASSSGVRIWDIVTGIEVRNLDLGKRALVDVKPNDDVQQIAFSKNGERITGVTSWSIKIWDAQSYSLISDYRHGFIPFDEGDYPVVLSPDGSLMAKYGLGLKVAQIGSTKVDSLPHFDTTTSLNDEVSLDPGNSLLAIRRLSRLECWNTGTQKQVWHASLENKYGSTYNRILPVFSRNSQRLANIHGDVAVVWDVNTGNRVQEANISKSISCAAFSPDGQTLAVGTKEGNVCIWPLK